MPVFPQDPTALISQRLPSQTSQIVLTIHSGIQGKCRLWMGPEMLHSNQMMPMLPAWRPHLSCKVLGSPLKNYEVEADSNQSNLKDNFPAHLEGK